MWSSSSFQYQSRSWDIPYKKKLQKMGFHLSLLYIVHWCLLTFICSIILFLISSLYVHIGTMRQKDATRPKSIITIAMGFPHRRLVARRSNFESAALCSFLRSTPPFKTSSIHWNLQSPVRRLPSSEPLIKSSSSAVFSIVISDFTF